MPGSVERKGMPAFRVHTAETVPHHGQAELSDVVSKYGRVPNMLGVMAGAPPLLKGYRFLRDQFEETSLTPTERNIVLLTVSFENECQYCMAAHSSMASAQKVSPETIEALRAGTPIPDPKLEALRKFTSALVIDRGWPREECLKSLFEVGYSQENALEVILGIGMKMLSNFTNHLASPPLDRGFSALAWTKPQHHS